jgi:hypothetical protein
MTTARDGVDKNEYSVFGSTKKLKKSSKCKTFYFFQLRIAYSYCSASHRQTFDLSYITTRTPLALKAPENCREQTRTSIQT